jgi:hypothetical protein
MKRYYPVLFAGAALAVLTGCSFNVSSPSGWSDRDLKAVTNMVQSAGISAGLKSLEVENAFGAIRITGAETGPFNWSQKLTVHARTDDAVQQLASNLVCRAELAGDRLTLVVTVPDSRDPHNFQSDLEITVPKSVSVQLLDQYGGIEAANLSGDVSVKNRFGAVDVRDISGSVRAETSYAALKVKHTGPAVLKNQFGAIEADDVHGQLEAETSYAALDAHDIGGTVKLRNQFGAVRVGKAGAADLKTSYAELRVEEINGDARLVNQFGRVTGEGITGSIRAETSYEAMDITGPGGDFICHNQFGGIKVQATSATLTNLEARTSYAALTVRVPAGLKPALQAHTSYGDIESDFPVLMKPRGQDPFAGLPPGTPRINLQNQNGNVRVISE